MKILRDTPGSCPRGAGIRSHLTSPRFPYSKVCGSPTSAGSSWDHWTPSVTFPPTDRTYFKVMEPQPHQYRAPLSPPTPSFTLHPSLSQELRAAVPLQLSSWKWGAVGVPITTREVGPAIPPTVTREWGAAWSPASQQMGSNNASNQSPENGGSMTPTSQQNMAGNNYPDPSPENGGNNTPTYHLSPTNGVQNAPHLSPVNRG